MLACMHAACTCRWEKKKGKGKGKGRGKGKIFTVQTARDRPQAFRPRPCLCLSRCGHDGCRSENPRLSAKCLHDEISESGLRTVALSMMNGCAASRSLSRTPGVLHCCKRAGNTANRYLWFFL